MRLGVHISGDKTLLETIGHAVRLGCETMQIFVHSPQQWRTENFSGEECSKFRSELKSSGLNPLFVHISYLINLASPNPKLYHASINAYIEDIKEAESLGADYIVTHMGSHKDTSEEAGIKRFIKALNTIISETKNCSVKILLENTSGSGSWLGYNFTHHKKIIQGLDDKGRVGLCLDTAHAFLAGYDLSKNEGFDKMIKEIDEAVGLKWVRLVHLNDADGKLGAKHDRHQEIGKGGIGLEGIRRVLQHPALKDLPFILETPKSGDDDDLRNLKIVRELAEGR